MKKLNFISIILLWFISLSSLYASDEMTIKINGHEYKTLDIISKKIKEVYENNKQAIKAAMETEMNDAQNGDLEDINITLPKDISIQYHYNIGDCKIVCVIA